MTTTVDSLETEYRTISPLAIGALGLGLASGLALASPLLLALAIAGMVVAVMALRSIAANQDRVSGTSMAVAGLFLSVFVLMYVPARTWLRTQTLGARAELIAEEALQDIQKENVVDAHNLLRRVFLSEGDPLRPKIGMPDVDKEAAESLKKFQATSGVKSLLELHGQFTWKRTGFAAVPAAEHADMLVVAYEIRPQNSAKKPYPLWVYVERKLDKQAVTWRLRELTTSDPAHAGR